MSPGANPTGSALDLSEVARAGSVIVTDALDLKSGLSFDIRPTTAQASFCGRAVTVQVEPGDNRAAYEALGDILPGDVLVVSCAGTVDVAMVGGTLAGHCRNLGAVGIVTDGMVRDVPAIERLGLPVWARGRIPNAPAKLAKGIVGQPVEIGGVWVATGDILVADDEGITAIPKSPPPNFSDRLRSFIEREEALEQAVERGESEPAWLRALRSASGDA